MGLTATSVTMPIIVAVGYVYFLLHKERNGSTIQYGCRQWGTHKPPRMGTARNEQLTFYYYFTNNRQDFY